MILTGSKIAECHKDGIIIIEPFDPDSITTDSYDFHLGNTLLCYKNRTLDARQDNETEEIQIPDDGIVLLKRIRPDHSWQIFDRKARIVCPYYCRFDRYRIHQPIHPDDERHTASKNLPWHADWSGDFLGSVWQYRQIV